MNRVVRRKLERIYADIPDAGCKGLCVEACGPICMTGLEYYRIVEARGGTEPGTVDPDTLTCPLLGEDGRCTVYDARPLICRLYGSAEGLECPYGCGPNRLLTVDEGRDLIRRMGEIDPVLFTLLPEHPLKRGDQ